MKYLGQSCVVLLAIAVTVWAAVYQGRLTNRWGLPADMLAAQTVMESLPSEFGSWRRQESKKLTPYEQKTLQCAGHVGGRYFNPESGATIDVSTLLGPPGPMSVHRPEICFPAVNFPQESERKRIVISSDDGEDTAWMVQFRKLNDASGGLKRAYYAWSDGGQWMADDAPRITFGTRPYLFKVQVVVDIPEEAGQTEDDPGKEFLAEFMPVFRKLVAEKNQPAMNSQRETNIREPSQAGA